MLTYLPQYLARWHERFNKYASIIHFIFTGLLSLFLIYQFWHIGWYSLIEALPQKPIFYLLFILYFFIVPLCDFAIFHSLWNPLSPSKLFKATLRKRIYSHSLLDYSGDISLYIWARSHLINSNLRIGHTIKDVALISAFLSTTSIIPALAFLEWIGALDLYNTGFSFYEILVFTTLVSALIFSIIKRYLTLNNVEIFKTSLLHCTRLLAVYILQFLLWHIGAPHAPLHYWGIFLGAQIIIHRVPFIPHRDLLLLGIGLQVANQLDAITTSLASVLLAMSFLEKVLSFTFSLIICVEQNKKISNVFSMSLKSIAKR